MNKRSMTFGEIEREIARLERSPLVKLARMESEIRAARCRYLSELRALEDRGKRLEEEGLTPEMLENGGSMCWD